MNIKSEDLKWTHSPSQDKLFYELPRSTYKHVFAQKKLLDCFPLRAEVIVGEHISVHIHQFFVHLPSCVVAKSFNAQMGLFAFHQQN